MVTLYTTSSPSSKSSSKSCDVAAGDSASTSVLRLREEARETSLFFRERRDCLPDSPTTLPGLDTALKAILHRTQKDDVNEKSDVAIT